MSLSPEAERATIRVAVAFSRADAVKLQTALGREIPLLGMTHDMPEVARAITPRLELNDEQALASDVRRLFVALEQQMEIDVLRGFANNFFECAVAPVTAWLAALDEFLSGHEGSGSEPEVWFATRPMIAPRSSAYYMAEHESQGVRFYSRAAVFQPYLVELCRRRGARPRFLRTRLGGRLLTDRPARLVTVLGARLAAGLLGIRRRLRQAQYAEQADLIAVTRAPAQTNFLEPLLCATERPSILLAAEIFVGRGRNGALVDAIGREHPQVRGMPLTQNSPCALVHDYAAVARWVARPPRARLVFRDVELRLEQALAEVLVMVPELVSYRRALHEAVRRLGAPRSRLLVSTEQKSPHAFADAWVATRVGLRCAHLMQCDQHSRPLPFPVFGDYFLSDTAHKAASLAAVWGRDAGKVRYIGTIKACSPRPAIPDAAFQAPASWCFFTQPIDVEANMKVLHLLRSAGRELGFELLVKLHPRDRGARYRGIDGITVIGDGELRQRDLFARFTAAVSFPSGVVLDLLFAGKPFALLHFGPGTNAAEYNYFDPAYAGNVRAPYKLIELVRDVEALAHAFAAYRDRFLKTHGIVSDPGRIRDALLGLTERGELTPDEVESAAGKS